MLHEARMAGLEKLRCGIVTDCGGRLRAGHVPNADDRPRLCKLRYLRIADLGLWRSMGAIELHP